MILAIDPGYNNYGCVVYDSYEMPIYCTTLHTKPSKQKLKRIADDDVQRISLLVRQLGTLISERQIKGIVGELPPSNSLSAKGAKSLSFAVALSVALFTERKLPVEWATPTEVKYALTKKNGASKEEMMQAACKLYDWPICQKTIYSKGTKTVLRTDTLYHVRGEILGKNQFEHMADAIGAYHALKHTNTVRLINHR